MPIVETTLECINHYNKANLAGFAKTGYFILRDVIICEHGKKDEIRKQLLKSLDGFGGMVTGGSVSGGADMRKK